jgi:hypothetical protein
LSIIETLAVFAGIPLAVVAVVVGLVYAGGGDFGTRSAARRYRPGRPFDFTPVWFLSAPDAQPDMPATSNGHAAITGANRMALTKADEQVQDVTGGASDRW